MNENHLIKRIRERIGTDFCAYKLRDDIVKALSDTEKYHDFIEKVITIKGGAEIYRIRIIKDQVHYVLTTSCRKPKTILTQEMIGIYKRSAK